jgi:hypothetical protein
MPMEATQRGIRSRTAAVLLLLSACTNDRQPPASSSPASAAVDSTVWLTRQRTMDFTGDGIPDTVRFEPRSAFAGWAGADEAQVNSLHGQGIHRLAPGLRALGRAPDSLRIALVFWSGGAERWREDWASDYELVTAPALEDEAARAAFVRSRLERALASVEVEPFDRASYETMADPVDSAVLRAPPSHQVSFAYGYETTIVLAWDPASAKLRLLHACC